MPKVTGHAAGGGAGARTCRRWTGRAGGCGEVSKDVKECARPPRAEARQSETARRTRPRTQPPPPNVTLGEPSVTGGERNVTVGEPAVTIGERNVTFGEPAVTVGELWPRLSSSGSSTRAP